MAHFQTVLYGLLIGGALTLVLLAVLRATYRQNRLLFWCVVGALAMHGLFSGVLWGAGLLAKEEAPAPTRYIRIHPATPPPPTPPPVLPKPQVQPPVKRFAVKPGLQNAERTDAAPPLGDNRFTDPGVPGRSGGNQQPPTNNRPLSEARYIFTIDDADSTLYAPERGGVSRSDLPGTGPGTGEGGNGGGVSDGKRGGRWGRGIPHTGDAGGNSRIYFVRLKHGEGGWNAHNAGINRLLAFLNTQLPCEQEAWALSTKELHGYMAKGEQPAFLYLYVDESFALAVSEVRVLHDYLQRGGFLFIDSRYDPAVMTRVTHELGRILPGGRLAPLAASHPINRFLYKLSAPGVGLNFVEQRNYGLTWQHRLAVFYTPGNFAECYELHAANEHEYFTAQYQMGANVMAYAITGGDGSAVRQQSGADARVSTQTLERLGLALSTRTPAREETPVKVPAPTVREQNRENLPATPDEIDVLVE